VTLSNPTSADGDSPVRSEIREEVERLTLAAVASGLPLRLMGGTAVWLVSPTVRRAPLAREYRDLDFAAASKGGRAAIKAFFEAQGYVPEKLFNALHGAQRLNYAAPDGRWTIDVVFDELNMSHRIDLRGRLNGGKPTIDLADLLLTKLQIWEINRKDLGDALGLLCDHPLADGRDNAIDLRRIRELTSADWGLCHTVERNLRRVRELWTELAMTDTPLDGDRQATELLAAIDAAPKSLAWKTRSRLGERVRWYQTPEEVRH
jgi:hypothetical protein